MENSDNQQFNTSPNGFNNQMQIKLPNETIILVMGIVSIVLACCCYGILGIGLGIAAMIMAKKAKELYDANPEQYLDSSIKNINAGRITGIIGIVVGVLVFIISIFVLMSNGIEAFTNPRQMQEIIEQMQNQ